jgi:hypothetical protein
MSCTNRPISLILGPQRLQISTTLRAHWPMNLLRMKCNTSVHARDYNSLQESGILQAGVAFSRLLHP